MKTTAIRYAYLNGIEYVPLAIQADSDELAARGRRLIFRHGHATQPKSEVLIAEKGVLHSGWVIGLATNEAKASERTVDLIVALNTLANYASAARRGVYFNSPDSAYFDGSAEGYWTRVCLELGADASEINEILYINLNPVETAKP